MVHSSYRGRTELRGPADLHIKGVDIVDHATYYCFVLLKFCKGNNIMDSIIQYGNGTKLDGNGSLESRRNYDVLTVVLYVGIKNLILAVLLTLSLLYLKRRRLQSDGEPEIYLQPLES
ncbi:hypothetical protein GDO81_020536 [Engystomops pustulosus]|uniref:Immunoglobulin V-set domain-containing protein n=1 Tax=Engystomops pustulosus TaxID=76066 RepID=A0AAV6YXL8_ENGPU|nr:hypothetical protein GDO81_020536 [Engystomops pustulosus]